MPQYPDLFGPPIVARRVGLVEKSLKSSKRSAATTLSASNVFPTMALIVIKRDLVDRPG